MFRPRLAGDTCEALQTISNEVVIGNTFPRDGVMNGHIRATIVLSA